MILRVVILALTIYYVKSQKCESCVVRNDKQVQKCICNNNHYCNITTKACEKCDSDEFRCWNTKLKNSKTRIQSIFTNLIEPYENATQTVEKLLRSVTKNEQELEEMEINSKKIDEEIIEIDDKIKILRKSIKTLKNKFGRLPAILSADDVTNQLEKLKDKVTDTKNAISRFQFDTDDLPNFEFLKNMTMDIQNMDTNLKTNNTSYNLVLLVDSELDLTEIVVNNYSNKILKINTTWIEEEILWLWDLLINYTNINLDVKELLKNAQFIRDFYEKLLEKLEQLLAKHEKYRKDLNIAKNELKFYKNVKNLQKKIKSIQKRTAEVLEKLKNLNLQLIERRQSVTELQGSISKTNDKTNEALLNNLLEEQTRLLERFEKLQNGQPIAVIKKEVSEMISKITKLADQIRNKCKS